MQFRGNLKLLIENQIKRNLNLRKNKLKIQDRKNTNKINKYYDYIYYIYMWLLKGFFKSKEEYLKISTIKIQKQNLLYPQIFNLCYNHNISMKEKIDKAAPFMETVLSLAKHLQASSNNDAYRLFYHVVKQEAEYEEYEDDQHTVFFVYCKIFYNFLYIYKYHPLILDRYIYNYKRNVPLIIGFFYQSLVKEINNNVFLKSFKFDINIPGSKEKINFCTNFEKVLAFRIIPKCIFPLSKSSIPIFSNKNNFDMKLFSFQIALRLKKEFYVKHMIRKFQCVNRRKRYKKLKLFYVKRSNRLYRSYMYNKYNFIDFENELDKIYGLNTY